jgi:hypothetical protein
MRTILFITATIISSVAFGQVGALISWDKSNYDFGDIRQGEKVEYTFRFHNSGDEPLMITNVTTQCGCTAPKGWPRDPIQPGTRGEITLVFDSSGKFGRVNKVATVMSNAVNKNSTQVLLSGNILEKKLANRP